MFLIIVNVLGHPKGVGGLTSYFLRGVGMDVFWNDPISKLAGHASAHVVFIHFLDSIHMERDQAGLADLL